MEQRHRDRIDPSIDESTTRPELRRPDGTALAERQRLPWPSDVERERLRPKVIDASYPPVTPMAPTELEARYRILLIDLDKSSWRETESVLGPSFGVTGCVSTRQALRRLELERYHVACIDGRGQSKESFDLLKRVGQLRDYIGRVLLTRPDQLQGIPGASGLNGRMAMADGCYVLLKPVAPGRLRSVVSQLARVAEMKWAVAALGAPRMEMEKARAAREDQPSRPPPSSDER
ncbi:MAG: hypothetical protein HOW73_38225 [Polyangiaceae bacterium]|nr:hypothetical protein [Polyangiaceae bacterium]